MPVMRARTSPSGQFTSAPMAHQSGFTRKRQWQRKRVKRQEADDAYKLRGTMTGATITSLWHRNRSARRSARSPVYAYDDYVVQVPTDRCQVLAWWLQTVEMGILASGWYSRYAAGTFSKANCKMYSLLMGRPTKKCGRSPTALLQRVCPSVGCNLLLLSCFTVVANLGPK